ncbi:hypothetical protein SDC9_76783 [bioreactor metagenome]|uniref:Glycosyltransferase RgtA/B/C/D-like domain-containing protein n=1 Tax=bioreactor metagenome TaxID=1076179 RepID=A0A644YNR1_9ZZZZ
MWFNYFLKGEFWGNFLVLLRVFWGYPPLVYFFSSLWSIIFGVSIAKITLVNTLFLVGAILGVYFLAKEISRNNLVALFSAVLFSLFPVIGDISRNMILDLPLLVWVVWGWYFWLKSNDLKNIKYAWLFWLMIVLSSLTKLNGFLYLIPALLILFFKSLKDINIFLKLVIGGLIYIVFVGWWWIGNWSSIYQYLTGLAGQGEALTDPMNLLEWQTWIHYLKLMVLHQIGPVTFFVGLFLAFWVPKKEKKNVWLLIVAVLIYIIFTIIKNKDFRFTLPILAPMAIWMAWGGVELIKKINKFFGLFIFILLISWLSFNFIENGFGWPIKKTVVLASKLPILGDVEWIGFDDYPVRAINKSVWPNEKIVNDLSEEVKGEDQTKNVLMLVNIEELNDNNLSLYKTILKQEKIEFGSVGIINQFNNDEEIENMIKNFDYVLVPEINYEASPFYSINFKALGQARDWVWTNRDKFETLREYKLPNQKNIFLMKKIGI